MPDERRAVVVERVLQPHEVARLRRGLIPGQMEDKWFVYWTDVDNRSANVTFHRSWTGLCVFIVDVALDVHGGGRVTGAVANNAAGQSPVTDDDDRSLVNQLIDGVLSRR
jgi:hypothetical protein